MPVHKTGGVNRQSGLVNSRADSFLFFLFRRLFGMALARSLDGCVLGGLGVFTLGLGCCVAVLDGWVLFAMGGWMDACLLDLVCGCS